MEEIKPKIVVLTPIKNEEWILERFLSVTSQFADHIIIADQNSTDESVSICKLYPKVTLIQNPSDEYNEADRQILLIQTARRLVPEHKILLALDADEILAANATQTLGWQTMLKAKPGTVLYFEKPDLYLTPNQAIRYSTPWPIGYVDDGIEHQPVKIHSIRIPRPDYAPILHIHDVKILHYGLARKSGQDSKMRFYSVIENTLKTRSLWGRRLIYSSDKNYIQAYKLTPSEAEWFTSWEKMGIDMLSISHQKYYWYDFEVLQYFKQYGCYRFWLDDIWKFDWEYCRLYAQSIGITGISEHKIFTPPKIVRWLATIFMQGYIFVQELAKILR